MPMNAIHVVSDDFLVDNPTQVRPAQAITALVDFAQPVNSSHASAPTLAETAPFHHEMIHSAIPKTALVDKVKKPKKRRSLQSLLVPSFKQSSPAQTAVASDIQTASPPRPRTHSAVAHSYHLGFESDGLASRQETPPSLATRPPPFPLDDDPFANLSSSSTAPSSSTSYLSPENSLSAPSLSSCAYSSSVPRPPRSPLSPTKTASRSTGNLTILSLPFATPFTPPPLVRPKSSGYGQARPAYTKPAFTPRPSLPSLNTLVKMNVAVPRKVRKGTVGAWLPHEPWNLAFVRPSGSPPQNVTRVPVTQSMILPPATRADVSRSESPGFARTSRSKDVFGVADFSTRNGELLTVRHASAQGSQGPAVSSQGLQPMPADATTTTAQDDTDVDSLPSLSYSRSQSDLSHPLSRSSSLASVSSSSASMQESSVSETARSSQHMQNEEYGVDERDLYTEADADEQYPADDDGGDPLSDYYSEVFADYLSEPTSDDDLDHGHARGAEFRSLSPDYVPHVFREKRASGGAGQTFEPGTSFGTIRGTLHEWAQIREQVTSVGGVDEALWEVVDSGERGRNGYEAHQDQNQDQISASGGGGGEQEGNGGECPKKNDVCDGSGSGAGRQGTGDEDDRDRDEDGDRKREARTSISSTSEYSSSSDEEDGAATVYYSGDEGTSNKASTRPESPSQSESPAYPEQEGSSAASAGSDDDVPLAQRIPTALKAQRTIRKQVQDEKNRRRSERATKTTTRSLSREPRSAVSTRRMTMEGSRAVGTSSGQEAIAHSSSLPSHRRERTSQRPPALEPFVADDLSKKLMTLQTSHSLPSATLPSDSTHGSRLTAEPKDVKPPLRSSNQVAPVDPTIISQQHQMPPSSYDAHVQERSGRTSRSLHRSDQRKLDYRQYPRDAHGEQRVGRSLTTSKRGPSESVTLRVDANALPSRGVSEGGAVSLEKATRHPRSSEEGRRTNKDVSAHAAPRTSEADDPAARRVAQRPPVPVVPSTEVAAPSSQKVTAVQQRIFIGDMQRFKMVEVSSSTNGADVVKLLATQGLLEVPQGNTGWMLWEICQDFGMERPVRSFELLSDVSESWNKDKMVNTFMVKISPLAPLLARSALPSSAPTNRGWLQWESKRGKWSKRWMELREHGLWLSKRDSGKDEVFLCSMSNFDAYYVTRPHKAPRPFVFAIKSTDKLSLFEDAADYLHVFSCNETEGQKWVQAILVARSYVLYQERNVLFTSGPAPTSQNKPLSRSGTRRSAAQRTMQPLVNVPAPTAPANIPHVFEPGSLLAKR